MAEMIGAFKAGQIGRAIELNARMIESYEFETGDLNPNPVPTKAMLRAIGQPAGPCRPPMGFGPTDLEERARGVHQRLYA
jgi:4-hydroxy-tetrahydrodipicolinate synthase